jgi:hypothetical protein
MSWSTVDNGAYDNLKWGFFHQKYLWYTVGDRKRWYNYYDHVKCIVLYILSCWLVRLCQRIASILNLLTVVCKYYWVIIFKGSGDWLGFSKEECMVCCFLEFQYIAFQWGLRIRTARQKYTMTRTMTQTLEDHTSQYFCQVIWHRDFSFLRYRETII